MRVDETEDYSHYNYMAVIDLNSELQASAPAIWRAVKTPSAFRRVTRGLLVMPAIRARDKTWEEGETVVGWVFLFGFIPFSRHTLHLSVIDDTTRTLSSRESGGLVRTWNHDIIVTPVGDRCCVYRDRVEIDAGIFTPVVALYAAWFYRARQRRWRALAKELNS